MQYQLKKSRRKTVAIHLTKEGKVEVRAPYGFSRAEADFVVAEKQEWILAHLENIVARNLAKEQWALSGGGTVYILGKGYVAKETKEAEAYLAEDGFYLPAGGEEKKKNALLSFYKQMAEKEMTKRVAFYQDKMNLTVKSIRITSAKTRWGSCSAGGRLHFSCFLMAADPLALDYVAVHELSHILQPNHSADFWEVVHTYFPRVKEAKALLKIAAERLAAQNFDTSRR